MVIDRDQALERLAGNEALLDMLIKKFITDNQSAADKLNELIADNDLEEAGRFVHSIKGAAGNLSMNQLFLSAKNLENSIKQQNQIDAQLKADFEQDLQAVLNYQN
ncbi:Hpt domain-containing protein [Catenovulum sp. 2E275]|uniref:Hpt domain-containing protein n=1 Tax=Catenovulum sp. 2E275 TaxID=2980497 RepID=UPI0021D36980|nr:Hpt domain-containing protein [Catenovulum sp. 2E275]MCU4677423.1 Hpt domain-containing protein [Catenovulum sp. 2E275]